MSGPLDARALTAPLAALSAPAWVVGGGLRDALLARPVADIDVITAGDPAAEAAAIARAHRASRFRLSRDFGAWRVSGGSLPCQVDVMPVLGDGLDDDLSRRDFTINALALAASGKGEVIDRARATALVFRLAREERDAWANWPARIAALMAAELSLEAHTMQKVLETHVRAHLADLAEVATDFR